MEKKIFIAVLFLIFAGCNDEPPLIPGLIKSRVIVRTDPETAEVFFNNSSASVPTPAQFSELEPGFFRVHFRAAKYLDTSFYLFLRRNVSDSIFVQITEDPAFWWKYYAPSNSQMPTTAVNKIVLDRDKSPLILTGNKGIVKFSGSTFTTIESTNSGLPDNAVNDLAIDKNGVFWIATNMGLARFDGIQWTVYNATNTNLPENKITSVAVDDNRIVWIGTYNSGLVKFDGVSFMTYSIFNSELPSNKVTCIVVDKNNAKWIGTRGEGVAAFDGIEWKVYNKLKHTLLSDFVSAIAFDAAGNPWIGCGSASSPGGLSVLKNEKFTNYSSANSRLPGNVVNTVFFDSKNVLWVGTEDGGMAKYDGKLWRVYNMYNSGLKQNNVSTISVDGQGNKYIGAFGFFVYTGQR